MPIGAAQPEYSGQPKGWYDESKMKVGLCLGLWVRCLGLWVIVFTRSKIGKKKKITMKMEKENQALIP